MDMTITPEGTYSAVLELRDTTGTVFDTEPDCSPYTDPDVVGEHTGSDITAQPLTGEAGSGCQITISSVKIPTAQDAADNALVVRDGDQYKVTLPEFDAADDVADSASTASSNTAPNYSLEQLTAAHVSITFPGAVTSASDGGAIDGRTVTWDNPDDLANGVQAWGYATVNEGTRPWIPWTAGGLIFIGLGLCLALWYRRHSADGSIK